MPGSDLIDQVPPIAITKTDITEYHRDRISNNIGCFLYARCADDEVPQFRQSRFDFVSSGAGHRHQRPARIGSPVASTLLKHPSQA
jgi:hypothetical protein